MSSLEMDSTLHYCIKQEKQSIHVEWNSNKWTMLKHKKVTISKIINFSSVQMSKHVQFLHDWVVLYFWPVFNWLKKKKKVKNIQCTYTYSSKKSKKVPIGFMRQHVWLSESCLGQSWGSWAARWPLPCLAQCEGH